MQANVSIKRIREFLLKENMNENDIDHDDIKGDLNVFDTKYSKLKVNLKRHFNKIEQLLFWLG